MMHLVALPILLSAPSTSIDPPAVAVGAHFRIECHFDHPESARQALAVAEAVWPVATGLYPDETADREGTVEEGPLVVHLYEDEEAYSVAENQLTGGLYRRNQAFAHRRSRTAHVAVQPALSVAALDELGLPEQTLRLIAHEAAHLARFARMPNNALHPTWYVDGNAGFIDQEVMEAIGRSPGLERDPWTSQELLSLQRMLDEGRLPTVREVFRNTLDGLSFYERYALRHFFFRFLWEEGYRDELDDIRDCFRQLVRGSDTPTLLARRIHGILDRVGGMETLDQPFHRYLRAFVPMWEEVHRSLALRDGAWLQTGFPKVDATAWSTQLPASNEYHLRGELELLAGEEPQLNLHFARSDEGFLTITFVAGQAPRLYRYVNADGTWRFLAKGREETQVGRPQSFELTVQNRRVSLSVGGVFSLGGHFDLDPKGAWGLAAHSGSAGRWKGLQLTPIGRSRNGPR